MSEETEPHGSTDRPTTPTVLRLRGPDDILAAVPVLLGFEPQDSLVLVTVPSAPERRGPHLRVDLPEERSEEAVGELIDVVLHPCVRHGVESVAVVVYTCDAELADLVADRLHEGFTEVGIGILVAIIAEPRRWRRWGEDAVADGSWRPYRSRDHAIRADAVLRGEVIHRSRKELAALLDPLHGFPARAVVAAVEQERRGSRERTTGAEQLWVASSVTRWTRAPEGLREPSHAEAARMLLALEIGTNRDAAWRDLTRASARTHRELWIGLTRRAPAGLRAGPAALVALTSWLAGNGALAWCAVDVCLDEVPRHGLGCLVRDLLEAATPPTWWDEVARVLDPDPA